jgi:sensory rhodopsin
MIDLVFTIGIILFSISSVFFFVLSPPKNGLRSAFIISFITLISYVLMWQGTLTVTTNSGEPIFWSRWLFYGASCTLLMFEISQLKGIAGNKLLELLFLTMIVMITGFLAARDITSVRWIHFFVSSVAYILLIVQILGVKGKEARWVNPYIIFGWTVFPIVFFFAPTGLGLIGSAVANLLYLLLDIYTKIIFNIQLNRKS